MEPFRTHDLQPPRKPSMKQRIPRLPRCQTSVLVTMHPVIGFHSTARGWNLVDTDFGQREHWKKVNITIKKGVQPGQPFCPDSWKQSWLYNWQTKQKILFYMELISITTHQQVSKISEFINISKMKVSFEFNVWLNPSWVDCAKYLAVTTCQFCVL